MTETQNIENNFSKPLRSVAELVEAAGRLSPVNVVIPGGSRVEDLRLVESARDHGIIDRAVLVGGSKQIQKIADEAAIDIDPGDIINAENDELIGETVVDLINGGKVDVVLKGDMSTPVINRYMLKVAVRETVSLASVFDAAPVGKGRPMVLTDAGFTTVCSPERMVHLVENAVDVARDVMGIDRPRVAILSANEKQIPSLPSTGIGLELAQRSWDNAIVCGPLSFDLATDTDSVAIKGVPDLPNADEVAGKADVLVCPGIDSANILYKCISAMAKYGIASIAGITVGFKVPYIILSRSDGLSTRLESVALCSIFAHRSTGP